MESKNNDIEIQTVVNKETGEIIEQIVPAILDEDDKKLLELSRQTNIRIKIFDDREPPEIRYALIKNGWTQRRLYAGDYWFFSGNFKRIGIERKEVRDLLGSMNTRIEHELEASLEKYDRVILIIEGSWDVALGGKIITASGLAKESFEMVWNFLQTWEDKGVKIQLSPNLGWTAKRLDQLYAYYQKEWHTGGIKADTFGDDRVMAFPSGTRGKKALACLEMFGSLERVAMAKVENLMYVDGIGKSNAEKIYNHFHKMKNPEQYFKDGNVDKGVMEMD